MEHNDENWITSETQQWEQEHTLRPSSASGGQSERLRNATRTQVEHNWNQVEHKLNIAKRAEPKLGE